MNLKSIQNNKTKTILQFAIPSIIAMILTSLITIVDGYFIGNYVGKEAIAAVNLGLPIVYLFLAVGLMVSVGGMAIAGMALGGKDISKCNSVFNQTMSTATVITVLLGIVMWLLFNPILRIVGADELVSSYFKDYYGIMILALPIMVINSSFGMFIRGEGKTQFYMWVNVVGILINIVLDYVFVRWLELGVKGVAFASFVSVTVSIILSIYFFLKKSEVYKFHRFLFSKKVFKSTILNGSSEFIGEMSMSISMFAYNFVIMKYIGVDGVTAFTIVGYISYILA